MLRRKGFVLLATDEPPSSLAEPENLCFDALFANLAQDRTDRTDDRPSGNRVSTWSDISCAIHPSKDRI